MYRMIASSFLCLVVMTPVAPAQEAPFKSLWPFGGSEKSARSGKSGFPSLNPFSDRSTPSKSSSNFGLPSPKKVFDRLGESTDAMLDKTRSTWRGMQDFGRGLMPFRSESEPKKKKRTSFFSALLPKKQSSGGPPATVNDFLSLERPKF